MKQILDCLWTSLCGLGQISQQQYTISSLWIISSLFLLHMSKQEVESCTCLGRMVRELVVYLADEGQVVYESFKPRSDDSPLIYPLWIPRSCLNPRLNSIYCIRGYTDTLLRNLWKFTFPPGLVFRKIPDINRLEIIQTTSMCRIEKFELER